MSERVQTYTHPLWLLLLVPDGGGAQLVRRADDLVARDHDHRGRLARVAVASAHRARSGMGQWSADVPVTQRCPLDHQVCRFWRDYEQSLRTDRCAFDDPNLCTYWPALRRVTQAELLSPARWSAILAFNLGRFDHLIDRQRYRDASLEYPGKRP